VCWCRKESVGDDDANRMAAVSMATDARRDRRVRIGMVELVRLAFLLSRSAVDEMK